MRPRGPSVWKISWVPTKERSRGSGLRGKMEGSQGMKTSARVVAARKRRAAMGLRQDCQRRRRQAARKAMAAMVARRPAVERTFMARTARMPPMPEPKRLAA